MTVRDAALSRIAKSIKSVSSMGHSDEFWLALANVIMTDLESAGFDVVEIEEL